MNHKLTCYRYWPKNKPIPSGWVKTGKMEDSHHGEWSVIIMEAKMYYTDPIKAAWMAREFGVRYSRGDQCVIGYYGAFDVTQLANCDLPFVVHPDSLHIFEPMEGDVVQTKDGFFESIDSGCRKISGIRQVDANGNQGPFYDYAGEDGEDWFMPDDPIKIIQRNGKAFFMPEMEGV